MMYIVARGSYKKRDLQRVWRNARNGAAMTEPGFGRSWWYMVMLQIEQMRSWHQDGKFEDVKKRQMS